MIYFYGDVKKADPFTVKEQLNRFIERREPALARIVERETRTMGDSISYEDIRNALLDGNISEEWAEKWRVLYSEFIIEVMVPVWRESMATSVRQINERFPKFLFDPNTQAVQDWVADRGAMLVTNVVEQQRNAIRAMVGKAMQLDSGISVDELAKIIRPVVGLYPAQAVANLKYYNFVKKTLTEKHPKTKPEKIQERAQRAAARYASTQHRARAMTIARTEMAFAYNAGEFNAVQQAIEKNYMGRTVKVPISARDGERVCKFCKDIDGKQFEMEEEILTPTGLMAKCCPWHPRCRCVMTYEELEPPIPFIG